MFAIRAFRRVSVALIVFCSAFLSAHAQSPAYKKWISEDVRWIISAQERADFEALRTDEQRTEFVKAFWLRRDPTPDTAENEFKEEHYRRLAFANQHFPEGVAGWKTDRGHIYIVNGPPDQIDIPSVLDKAPRQNGFVKQQPYEIWRYKHAVGPDHLKTFKFVDKCSCGKYELSDTPPLP